MSAENEVNPPKEGDKPENLSPEETRARFRHLSVPLVKPTLSMTDQEARERLDSFMKSLHQLRAKLG
jgi:hypothetical protein